MLDFKIPLEWIGECAKSHPECSNYSNSSTAHTPIFPTRLINVCPPDGNIRLVPSKTKAIGEEYLTLSHRWTSGMYTTTQRSLKSHLNRLPFEKLSVCFKDAIKITRQLGFQYLWIDALCIIQDSPSEMQDECLHMKDIYRNRAVMLAADRVENSKDGLYPARLESQSTPMPFRDTNGQQASQWILSNRQPAAFGSDVIHGTLNSRGWTLQERILAPRILHFGKSQLHWECRTSIWWEKTDFKCEFYTPIVLDEAREMMTAMTRKKLRTVSTRDIAGISNGCTHYTTWYDLVSAYSCRQLTFLGDRLIAILGLADFCAEIVQDRFVWGLWRQDLPAGLLWAVQATGPLTRLAAPSWSWASIDGELTFYIPSTKWGRPLHGTLQKTCEDIVIENSVIAHRTYANGKISCLCPLTLVLLSVFADSNENEKDSFDHLRKQPNATVREESSRRVIGDATLDDDSLLPKQNFLQPLPLHTMMLYRQDAVPGDCQLKLSKKQIQMSYCLLLKLGVKDGLFRRCGYAEIDPKAFSNAEVRRIAIV
jgi:hypothetical protein